MRGRASGRFVTVEQLAHRARRVLAFHSQELRPTLERGLHNIHHRRSGHLVEAGVSSLRWLRPGEVVVDA